MNILSINELKLARILFAIAATNADPLSSTPPLYFNMVESLRDEAKWDDLMAALQAVCDESNPVNAAPFDANERFDAIEAELHGLTGWADLLRPRMVDAMLDASERGAYVVDDQPADAYEHRDPFAAEYEARGPLFDPICWDGITDADFTTGTPGGAAFMDFIQDRDPGDERDESDHAELVLATLRPWSAEERQIFAASKNKTLRDLVESIQCTDAATRFERVLARADEIQSARVLEREEARKAQDADVKVAGEREFIHDYGYRPSQRGAEQAAEQGRKDAAFKQAWAHRERSCSHWGLH